MRVLKWLFFLNLDNILSSWMLFWKGMSRSYFGRWLQQRAAGKPT
jgi:hypothetical protein